MAIYIPEPITLREVNGLVIAQAGDQATVNGIPAQMVLATTIVSNTKHYLRAPLASVMPRLQSGEIAAVVVAQVNGKSAQILINAAEFATGAPERARHAAWYAEFVAAHNDRAAKERAYDLINNEGGEGYNPHRATSERTYARNVIRERHYPEGA